MEPVKDHYKVLNVTPSASTAEIKKAFRKLALQYHPDKNHTRSAITLFAAIQEAYLVLSDSKKRAEYNYKRYTQNPQHAARTVIQVAEDVLFLSGRLKKEILSKDPLRIDRDLLFFQLSDLLSEDAISVLKESDNPEIVSAVTSDIMACVKFLPYDFAIAIFQKISPLENVAPAIKQNLADARMQVKQQYYWNRYKFLFALLVAGLVCLFIYLAQH